MCKSNGGNCVAYVDGYYTATAICTLLGFIWYGVFRKIINKYQSLGLFHYVGYGQAKSGTKEVISA